MKRALGLYVAVAIAFAPDAAIGQGVFWHHDLRHHHDPWRAWAAAKWLAGEVPWWASGAGNGFPLLAEGEGGFLYPPTMLLYMLLPGALALNWAVLGHQVLAAMGMWALCRARGLSAPAALLGGLAWGWSGFLVSHTLYLGMQNTAAWLGWALFAGVTARWWLVALSIGTMGLAGHPQAAAFGGLLCLGHALATGLGWRWFVAAAAGVVIASPQLLATWELSRASLRAGGVSADFAQIGALPLPELVKAVLPYAFGFDRAADVTQTYLHRGPGYWGPGVNAWETSFYLGVPVAVLALLGSRRARGWAAVAGVAIVLMLGGPVWELLRHLPGLGGFRFPARFALWLAFAVALLAAHGLDALPALRRPPRRALFAVAGAFLCLTALSFAALHLGETRLVAIGGAFFQRRIDAPLPPAVAGMPAPEAAAAAAIPAKVRHILDDLRLSTSPLSSRVWVPFGLLVLTALLLRRPRALVVLVAIDLWLYGHDLHPRVPAALTRAAPAWLVSSMREPGGPRLAVLDRHVDPALDTAVLSSSLGLLHGTNDVLVPSPLRLPQNDVVLALAGLDIAEPGTSGVGAYLRGLDVARRLGVRWIATTAELPGLARIVRGPVNLYLDDRALPRARVVPCREPVPDAIAALPTTDPRRTVLVETGERRCDVGGAAEIVSYADRRVEVRASGPGTLVLADTWYPEWSATVDGVVVPIERADAIFRAVPLGDGDHSVVFSHDAGAAGVALPIAAGVLFVVLGVGMAGARRYGTATATGGATKV